MFEFLSSLPPSDATGGVYYATRIIKHKKQLDELPYEFLAEADSEPTETHREIMGRIIQQIEQTEHVPLKNIPKHVAATYVQTLVKQLQKVLKEQWQYDDRRGTELLAQLRRSK